MSHNGYVYETFGTSKHFPVKLHQLLIRAKMFGNALIAKCFIYDVGISYLFNSSFNSVKFLASKISALPFKLPICIFIGSSV